MIEKTIDRNRNLFYDDDLPEGHLERFIKKLDSPEKQAIKIKRYRFYSIAAIFLLFLILAALIPFELNRNQQKKYMLAEISPELRETEIYYQDQINEKTTLLTKSNRIDPAILKSDLSEIDASLKSIHEDLMKNRTDERVINAVLSNYEAKIEMLDMLIQHNQ